MVKINYIQGDCLELSQQNKTKKDLILIPHICNNVGGYGSGFVAALNARWKEPRKEYVNWYDVRSYESKIFNAIVPFALGEIQFVKVPSNTNVGVINMIGQNGTISPDNPTPIKYDAVIECLQKVNQVCKVFKSKGANVEIHAPKFGSGLAGGNWDLLEKIIEMTITEIDEITIYVFP